MAEHGNALALVLSGGVRAASSCSVMNWASCNRHSLGKPQNGGIPEAVCQGRLVPGQGSSVRVTLR